MIHHRPRRSLCAAEAPTPCPRRWTSKVPKFARESWHHWAARHAIPGSSRRRNSQPLHLPLEQPAPLDNQSVSSVSISYEQAIYASASKGDRAVVPRLLHAPRSVLFALHSVPSEDLRPKTSFVSSNATGRFESSVRIWARLIASLAWLGSRKM